MKKISLFTLFICLVGLFNSCRQEVDLPVAQFIVNPSTEGYINDQFSFDAKTSSAGNCEDCILAEYIWDMGDGSEPKRTNEETFNYSYSSMGSFVVKLVVRNTMGYTSVDTATRIMNVSEYNNQRPEIPDLIYPQNQATKVPTILDFEWSCSDPDEDNLTYILKYGVTNPPGLMAANLSNDTYSNNTPLDEGTIYYWQIVASDGRGGMSESPVYSFVTEGVGVNYAPNKPNRPFPEDGSVDQALGTMLSWTCSDPNNDDLVYDLYLSTANSLTQPIATNLTETYYFNENQFFNSNQDYFWKVVAKDGLAETESNVWEFTTIAGNFNCPSSFTDDGQSYNAVQIGTQCWMSESLNKGIMITLDGPFTTQANNQTVEKYCLNDNETNCDTYGGLYEWDEMMGHSTQFPNQGICPDGWHIPSEQEWNQLVIQLGGVMVAGEKLKVGGTSGFNALFAGERNGGSFANENINGYFWSSTAKDTEDKFSVKVVNDLPKLVYEFEGKQKGKSIRCLKD
ncbi:MAG: PKD domain-containing protein [Bacteroidales bacterium]|nr:PKD domain-containing protein [Bacteroidales bacterium]